MTTATEQIEQLEALVTFNLGTIELLNTLVERQQEYIIRLNQTCTDATKTITNMSRVIGDQRIRIDLLNERLVESRKIEFVRNGN